MVLAGSSVSDVNTRVCKPGKTVKCLMACPGKLQAFWGDGATIWGMVGGMLRYMVGCSGGRSRVIFSFFIAQTSSVSETRKL